MVLSGRRGALTVLAASLVLASMTAAPRAEATHSRAAADKAIARVTRR
jgi:hypothetical protein